MYVLLSILVSSLSAVRITSPISIRITPHLLPDLLMSHSFTFPFYLFKFSSILRVGCIPSASDMSQLSNILADLASRPSAEILDALRGLERKTTTVFTLLKASVYSIVLQQEIFSDEGAAQEGSP